MGLYEFFFPEEARIRKLEDEVARLRSDSYDETAVRERLRRQWEEKHNPKPKPKVDIPARIAALEHEIATAHLIIEALLEELEARGGISRDALKQRIHEIDARDGKVDGRKTE